MKGKTHFRYLKFETMCGILFHDRPEKFKEKIGDVTCGICKKIVTVYKSDSHNRPKKNIAKIPLSTSNIKDGNNI